MEANTITIVIVSISLIMMATSGLTLYMTVWSNFEIADMDFWRSPAYQRYFDYLDAQGGFYYEVSTHPVLLSFSLPAGVRVADLTTCNTEMGRRTGPQYRSCALLTKG